MSTGDLVKIFFQLDPDDWHGMNTESLWAEPTKGSKTRDVFTIRNSPFYTRDVSYLDVVRAAPGRYIRGLDFVRLIISGGHSTYRLIVKGDGRDFQSHWKKLQDLGCTYESGELNSGMLYSIDVPETTDIRAVHSILEEGRNGNVWIFDEGRVGHKV